MRDSSSTLYGGRRAGRGKSAVVHGRTSQVGATARAIAVAKPNHVHSSPSVEVHDPAGARVEQSPRRAHEMAPRRRSTARIVDDRERRALARELRDGAHEVVAHGAYNQLCAQAERRRPRATACARDGLLHHRPTAAAAARRPDTARCESRRTRSRCCNERRCPTRAQRLASMPTPSPLSRVDPPRGF